MLAAAGAVSPPLLARAQENVVRYGISTADVPLTSDQPRRGAGATRLAKNPRAQRPFLRAIGAAINAISFNA
jgi:hypothetical protein